MDTFSKNLTSIENVDELSAYELNEQMEKAYVKMEEARNKVRLSLTKDEQKELFDNAFDLNKVDVYNALLETLTDKNLKSLEQVKGKWWINLKTKDFRTIFKLDNQNISFLNLENKLPYGIVDGRIIFEEKDHVGALFFELQDSVLLIRTTDGTTVKYKEANTIEDLILGSWYGDGYEYRSFRLDFKGNNMLTVSQGASSDEPEKYEVKGAKIKLKYGKTPWTITLPSNKLVLDIYGAWQNLYFYRKLLRDEPKGLGFLLREGDVQVKYTSTKSK